MFMFTLGTTPIFMALGFVTTRLSENFRAKFFKFAGGISNFIALSNINAALVLANSDLLGTILFGHLKKPFYQIPNPKP